MKTDRIDYKRKEKILTSSVITSTAVLLGLYLNNGAIVKADSLPNGQDVTQTSSSANTEAGSSTNQNENGTAETGTTNDTQTGTTTSPTDEEADQAISDVGDLTRSTRTFSWKGTDGVGVDLTFDETTGELTIPGGTEANPVVLTNPAPLYKTLPNLSDKVKKITITGKLKIIGSANELFRYLQNLTTIAGLDQLDTSEVTSMNSLFSDCKNLTSIDLSHFDTSRVTNMASMFYNASKLTSLDVSSFDTSKVTLMYSMFCGCSGLTSLDLSNFDTANVTDMRTMFCYVRLTNLDLSHFDTSKVVSMSFMFSECPNLTSLDLSNFDTANVFDMSYMFRNSGNLANLDISSFDTSKVKDMWCMFAGCTALKNLDVSHFDTSKVTNMISMFEGCESLTNLEVSHFDTSKVTGFSRMFSGCKSLTSLDVSHFDTSNAKYGMGYMFNECRNLTSLDVSHFNTSNITTTFERMFNGCEKLTNIDVSHFDTSKVTNMAYMFNKCFSLTELDLSNFVTSNVANMYQMFYSCENLTKLNIKNFDMSIVWRSRLGIENMLGGLVKLRIIVLGPKCYLQNAGFGLSGLTRAGTKSYVNYNSKWVNVADGTVEKPKGNKSWTMIDLGQNYNGPVDQDTYVRFGDVKVHYQDESGRQIAPDEVLTGKVDDKYQSVKKPISGYTFKEVRGDTTGTYGEMPKEVTYVYTKNPVMSKVTVHYQDENGNQIASDEVLTGKVGDNYQSTQKTINGYAFKEVKGGATGTIEETAKEVTYVYTKNPVMSKVTVHYQDENGNQIASDEVLTGKVGDNYQSVQKTINGYTFKEVKGGATGTIEETAKEVTYVYTKNPVMSKVTVHYQDENGNQIASDEVLTGKVGDNYQSTQKTINGYTFKEVKGGATGTIEETAKEVTYVYTKDPVLSKVTVHYQDENGNQIASDEVLTGKVGDNYQSTQKTINGYTFKEVKGGATGTIEETAKEVTYVYTKNPVMSKVTVHYQDENGNQIASDEVLTGKVGDNYQSTQKTINGYTFKEVKGGATGTIEEIAKEVTYVYTKNPSSPVVPTTTSKVTVHYQDENGNQIASDEVLTGKAGDNYQSVQKTISGYRFKEVRGNATGFFTANEQTVTYIYTKDDETATTTLPNYVPKPTKPNKNKSNNMNKVTGTNSQTVADKNQQKAVKPLAGDPNEAKPDSLPQTGASNEDKGILSILGSMMLLISSIGGAWFKRKQK